MTAPRNRHFVRASCMTVFFAASAVMLANDLFAQSLPPSASDAAAIDAIRLLSAPQAGELENSVADLYPKLAPSVVRIWQWTESFNGFVNLCEKHHPIPELWFSIPELRKEGVSFVLREPPKPAAITQTGATFDRLLASARERRNSRRLHRPPARRNCRPPQGWNSPIAVWGRKKRSQADSDGQHLAVCERLRSCHDEPSGVAGARLLRSMFEEYMNNG